MAFPTKSGQNISSSVGFTKTRAFAAKSGQNNSSSVGFTKTVLLHKNVGKTPP